MKKYLVGFVLALSGVNYSAYAQNHGIGLHFGAYDFYGPQTGDYLKSERLTYEYNDTRKLYDTAHHNKMYWRPMVKATYWYQINSSFDVNMGLSLASLEYPNGNDDTDYVNRYRTQSGDRRERMLAEYDVRVNYSILSRDHWIVSPYIFAGVNASYHDIFLGVDIPLGIGLNIGLNKAKTISLNLESAYKIAATDHDVNHLQHSLGFVYWFKPGYKVATVPSAAAVEAQAPLRDSDGDGIEDSEDACPTIAGLAQFNGCPDTDGDGISDKDDACPLVAGLAQFNGCPDTDGDGIPDQKDKCPYVAGTAAHDGCPIPDTDGDGFTDDVDRCPTVYSKTNQGCPEIRKEIISEVEKAAKAIFFETGKAAIKPISFKSLDAVVRILKNDPTLYADIEGHTDNVQPKTYTNMDLSQRRAESVKQYFVSKGVDESRLTSQGFGETQPIADNRTAPGRAQNRRTVIKLRNFAR